MAKMRIFKLDGKWVVEGIDLLPGYGGDRIRLYFTNYRSAIAYVKQRINEVDIIPTASGIGQTIAL